MILKCWYTATQCLPPGGRGTAKRWMRNGDTLPFAMQLIQTVQTFPIYLFNEVHTNMEHIAVPHPPQCAHWGTFPPGEGIARLSSQQIPINRFADESRYARISKSSPEGIPHLISYISYLKSRFPAPSATGDRGVRRCWGRVCGWRYGLGKSAGAFAPADWVFSAPPRG